jgi:hypothetical protein
LDRARQPRIRPRGPLDYLSDFTAQSYQNVSGARIVGGGTRQNTVTYPVSDIGGYPAPRLRPDPDPNLDLRSRTHERSLRQAQRSRSGRDGECGARRGGDVERRRGGWGLMCMARALDSRKRRSIIIVSEIIDVSAMRIVCAEKARAPTPQTMRSSRVKIQPGGHRTGNGWVCF